MACEAEADITQLYDQDGKLLPPQQWPKHLRACVEAVDLRDDGTGKIKLASQSAARKFLLELAGRTRSVADSIDHMAEAILADRAKHLPGSGGSKETPTTYTSPLTSVMSTGELDW